MSVPPQHKKDVFLKAYEEYADSIFKFCLVKLSHRDQALDAVQEVFARTWEYMCADKDIGNIKSFLFTTAYHIIVDSYRKKKTQSLDELSEEGFDMADDRGDVPLLSVDSEKVLKAVEKLDANYRDIIIMRYINEMFPKEIAEITGLSENVVSVRIHRGLEKLRTILNINE